MAPTRPTDITIETCTTRGVQTVTRRRWLPAAALTLITLLCYLNTLTAPFILDDHKDILNTAHLRLEKLTWDGLNRAIRQAPTPSRPVANLLLYEWFFFQGLKREWLLNLDHQVTLSTGLLTPWTTLPAVLGLAAGLGLALFMARGHRLGTFCVLWYLGNLGLALAASGNLDQAIAQYRIVLEMAPNNAPVWNNLGIALAQTNTADQAEAAFRQAIMAMDLDPATRLSPCRDGQRPPPGVLP